MVLGGVLSRSDCARVVPAWGGEFFLVELVGESLFELG